jgi:hypothetical protein
VVSVVRASASLFLCWELSERRTVWKICWLSEGPSALENVSGEKKCPRAILDEDVVAPLLPTRTLWCLSLRGGCCLLFLKSLKAASYLVDPSSSHMLVSKIKPCMSKYNPLEGETAKGSLNHT